MIEAPAIIELHRCCVAQWHHQAAPDNPYNDFLNLVCEQHQSNYLLWHQEDIARDPQVTDAEMAAVKRRIDQLNQQRNDRIERLDDELVARLEVAGIQPVGAARLNSETPGSVIDRLSILALRIYHMEEQAARPDADAAHRRKVEGRLLILREQRADLSAALGELLDDIFAGRKRLKVYRQFKMYNDPTLNPRIYGAAPPLRAAG